MAGAMNGVYGVGGGGGGAMAMDTTSDTSRGVKRQASDSNLTDLDRFEKRLRALSNDEKRAEKNKPPQFHKRVPSKPGVLSTGFRRPAAAPPPSPAPANDGMQVDDTRDRVYIADLDAELADTSSDDERLIFLPDIDKRLSRLPRQVYDPLSTSAGVGNDAQELVLYSDPRSLSVDEGHDSVRKAVLEARQRARVKAADEERTRQEVMERMYHNPAGAQAWSGDGAVETAHGYGDAGYISPLRLDQQEDPDAMDLG